MIEITIESADDEARDLIFDQESVTIGRGLGNDIMLEDPQVSRYHARIVLQSEALMLYDLRSRNGTRVNSERISSCAISITDAIFIGQSVLRVKIEGQEYEPVLASESSNGNGASNGHSAHLVDFDSEDDIENEPLGFSETKVYSSDQVELELSSREYSSDTPADTSVATESDGERPTTQPDLLQSGRGEPSDEPWRPFENCLAALLPFIEEETVSSITVIAPNRALIKRRGGVEEVEVHLSAGQLQEAFRIGSMSTRPNGCSQESRPMFALTLADGSQVSGCSSQLSPDHGMLVLVPAREGIRSADEFLQNSVIDSNMLFFLHGCVALRKTLVLAGPPATDSCGLLNALADFIPNDQRICVFGNPRRVALPHTHLVCLNSGDEVQAPVPGMNLRQIVTASSPDRLVLTEPLSGPLAADFLEVASSSCPGSLARIHATSPSAALAKLEIESHRTESGLPADAVRQQLYEAIDVIVQLTELPNGDQRVTRITEVTTDTGHVVLTDVFRLDRDRDSGEELVLLTAPSFLTDLRISGFDEAYQAFAN